MLMDQLQSARIYPRQFLMEIGIEYLLAIDELYLFPTRSTPPCPDNNRPATCIDGSLPVRVGGGRGGRSRCSRSEKICCDGSTPGKVSGLNRISE